MSEAYREQDHALEKLHLKTSKTIRRTLVGYSLFCILALLATHDVDLLNARSFMKIPWSTFLYWGPAILVGIALYLHFFVNHAAPTTPGAVLHNVNLQGATLWGTNLQGASLFGANLQGADLRFADLRGVRNLPFEQLASVRVLYGAKLDKALMEQIEQDFPHLLEGPS